MIEITYLQVVLTITIVWIIARTIVVCTGDRKFSLKRELQLILVYICIIVVVRFVNFPLEHVDGHIDTMKFDASKIYPFWLNLIPFVHLLDIYPGWLVNIIGNIAMFIPVGIIWPICFKKLDTVGKAFVAGAGFSLVIEVSQLLFFERCSDVDDLFLNSVGALIGSLIVFGIRKYRH